MGPLIHHQFVKLLDKRPMRVRYRLLVLQEYAVTMHPWVVGTDIRGNSALAWTNFLRCWLRFGLAILVVPSDERNGS